MEEKQTQMILVLGVLLVVAILAAKFLKPDEDDADDQDTVDLVDVATQDVDQITLVTAEGTLTADRVEGGWVLVSPTLAPGSSVALEDLVSLVDRLKVEPAIEGASPADFGFEPPAAALTLKRTDGGQLLLEVGDDTPVGSKSYVRLDGGAIQIASSRPRTTLTLPFDAYRERGVAHVTASTLSRIEIRSPEGAAVLQKEGTDWTLGDGRRARQPAVDSLVARVNGLQFEGFFGELSDTEAGFLVPYGELVLRDDAGETRLVIGDERAGGRLLKAPDGTIGSVGDIEGLLPAADELVEDRVLPVPQATLDYVAVDYDGAHREWSQLDGSWSLDGQPDPMGGQSAFSLVSALTTERAPMEQAPGAETGRLVARSAGREVTVVIGQELEGGRLAWEEGSGPAFLISTDNLALIQGVL